MHLKKVFLFTACILSLFISKTRACDFAYVVNRGDNTVSVIELNSNQEIATIAVGLSPRGIKITPDGAFAYVSNTNAHTVSVIDLSTNQVTATIAVGIAPIGIAIAPDGAFASW